MFFNFSVFFNSVDKLGEMNLEKCGDLPSFMLLYSLPFIVR